jgi:hypothetical protein
VILKNDPAAIIEVGIDKGDINLLFASLGLNGTAIVRNYKCSIGKNNKY